jgi:hypothetical protein
MAFILIMTFKMERRVVVFGMVIYYINYIFMISKLVVMLLVSEPD